MIIWKAAQANVLSVVIENAIQGEAWEIVSILDEDDVDVGRDENWGPLAYPLAMGSGTIPLHYFSSPIVVPETGSYTINLRDTAQSKTKAVSLFVDPHVDETPAPLLELTFVECSDTFITADGQPHVGLSVSFTTLEDLDVSDDDLTGGVGTVLRNQKSVVKSDKLGRISIFLLPGTTVRAAIGTSGFVKEFVVPSQNFRLMTVDSTNPDYQAVVTPDYDYLARRS